MKMSPESGMIEESTRLLEVTPIIITAFGDCVALPPVIWPVATELLGYGSQHLLGHPYQMMSQERLRILGTNGNLTADLQFMVRVMNAGETPYPSIPMDKDKVAELLVELGVIKKSDDE